MARDSIIIIIIIIKTNCYHEYSTWKIIPTKLSVRETTKLKKICTHNQDNNIKYHLI